MKLKRIKKGNALVVVTIVLFAISIIAGSLSMYFAVGNRLTAKNNRYFNNRIALSNEVNSNYKALLSKESVTLDDSTSLNLYTALNSFDEEGDSVTFVVNGYTNKIVCDSYTNSSNKEMTYSVSFVSNEREYIYSTNLTLSGGKYSLGTKEVYQDNAIS